MALVHDKNCKSNHYKDKQFWSCVPGCEVDIQQTWENYWKPIIMVGDKVRNLGALKQILYMLPKPNLTIQSEVPNGQSKPE